MFRQSPIPTYITNYTSEPIIFQHNLPSSVSTEIKQRRRGKIISRVIHLGEGIFLRRTCGNSSTGVSRRELFIAARFPSARPQIWNRLYKYSRKLHRQVSKARRGANVRRNALEKRGMYRWVFPPWLLPYVNRTKWPEISQIPINWGRSAHSPFAAEPMSSSLSTDEAWMELQEEINPQRRSGSRRPY